MNKKRYPSDIREEEWKKIEPIFEMNKKKAGQPRKYSTREMLNGILYILKSGCSWEMMPKDLPPYKRVHETFMRWKRRGVIDELLKNLRQEYRMLLGKDEEPTVAIVDSKTTKTIFNHETVGYDGYKKNQGK
jgi:putative transposase